MKAERGIDALGGRGVVVEGGLRVAGAREGTENDARDRVGVDARGRAGRRRRRRSRNK